MWVCESNGNVSSSVCVCVCVCACALGGVKKADRAGDIYVFYSGEGGGVKSPDP